MYIVSASGIFWINWEVFRIVNKTFRPKNIKWTICYRAAFSSYTKWNGIAYYHAEFSLHLPIPCCMNEFCQNMDFTLEDVLPYAYRKISILDHITRLIL